ncbi:MAG: M28 family peptidase [Clostridia bacterium]|nr:M28 family peptidase [Clostridia bacterium]
MTETAKEIFEKYQVRKTKKQKSKFIEFAKIKAEELSYEVKVEKGYLGARNIVVGDVKSAKVVYTAHYDTCAVLPFPNFITPKNFTIYLLYQILIVAVFFAVAFVLGFVFGFIGTFLKLPDIIIRYSAMAVYWILLILIFAGPANRHTANDNTSGVITLFSIMEKLPEEQRNKVAFVFFDLEEAGLFGSIGFASKHNREMKNKPLINFDCVSDGDNILFAIRRDAAKLSTKITDAFPESERFKVHALTKGVFYPSDQANFPLGIGVAALKSTRGGTLYMNRIHTVRDTVFEKENIELLTDGAVRLTEML